MLLARSFCSWFVYFLSFAFVSDFVRPVCVLLSIQKGCTLRAKRSGNFALKLPQNTRTMSLGSFCPIRHAKMPNEKKKRHWSQRRKICFEQLLFNFAFLLLGPQNFQENKLWKTTLQGKGLGRTTSSRYLGLLSSFWNVQAEKSIIIDITSLALDKSLGGNQFASIFFALKLHNRHEKECVTTFVIVLYGKHLFAFTFCDKPKDESQPFLCFQWQSFSTQLLWPSAQTLIKFQPLCV